MCLCGCVSALLICVILLDRKILSHPSELTVEFDLSELSLATN